MQEAPLLKFDYEQLLLCPKLNKARMICISQDCIKPALTCMQESCETCIKTHKKCRVINPGVLLQRVLLKRQEATPEIVTAIKTMERLYEELIERLSNDKHAISSQIDYLGYNIYEVDLMRLFKDGSILDITGVLTGKVCNSLLIKNDWLVTESIIIDFWEKRSKQLNKILNRFKNITNLTIPKLDSKVTSDASQIVEFFRGDVRIKSFNLLYRASENQFSSNEFHKVCDGVGNTLVLIRTQFGRIIGGFTPLQWGQDGGYRNDYQNQTFIFSLTNKERYNLIQKQYAICGTAGAGPSFGGGHDIHISDRANQPHSGSYFNFPTSFNNGKYNIGVSSFTSFCGSSSGDYQSAITEWEVYKVQFI